MITLKALLRCLYAEGVREFQHRVGAQRQPWVTNEKGQRTLKALGLCGINPFRVEIYCGYPVPRIVAALQSWAEISQRLRR